MQVVRSGGADAPDRNAIAVVGLVTDTQWKEVASLGDNWAMESLLKHAKCRR